MCLLSSYVVKSQLNRLEADWRDTKQVNALFVLTRHHSQSHLSREIFSYIFLSSDRQFRNSSSRLPIMHCPLLSYHRFDFTCFGT